MSGGDRKVPDPDRSRLWPEWLSPRQIVSYVARVIGLETSVRDLKAETARLRAEVERLRQDQIAQAAQLSILVGFVERSLTERVDLRAEATVLKILADRERKIEDGKP